MANTATATQFRPALERLEIRAVPAALLLAGSAGQVLPEPAPRVVVATATGGVIPTDNTAAEPLRSFASDGAPASVIGSPIPGPTPGGPITNWLTATAGSSGVLPDPGEGRQGHDVLPPVRGPLLASDTTANPGSRTGTAGAISVNIVLGGSPLQTADPVGVVPPNLGQMRFATGTLGVSAQGPVADTAPVMPHTSLLASGSPPNSVADSLELIERLLASAAGKDAVPQTKSATPPTGSPPLTAADIVPGGIITPTAMDTAADSISSGLRQFAQ